MKALKLAAIPAALIATSAFAQPVVVEQQVIAEPVAVSTTTYDAEAGMVKNTTTQVVEGTKTVFGTVTHPASISAEVGTTGYGVGLAWGLNDKTDLVAGWNGGKFDDNIDLDSDDSYINYRKVLGKGFKNFQGTLDYKADMSNPYLGVNLHPLSNGFTVGTGIIYNDSDASATLTPRTGGTNISINGTDYPVPKDSSLSVDAKYKNNLAPYLTLGYHPDITTRFGLFGEVGAAYVGKADVKVSGTNGVPQITIDAVQQEVDSRDNKWWPIAKVGATYRF